MTPIITPAGATTEIPLSGAKTALRNSSDITNQDTLPGRRFVSADILLNRVCARLYTRPECHAARIHPVAGNLIAADHVPSSFLQPGDATTEIDSRVQHLWFIPLVDAWKLARGFIASGQI